MSTLAKLPGIDHREHFLMRKISVHDPDWVTWYPIGKAALARPSTTAYALPCASALTSSSRTAVGFALVGGMLIGVLGVGLVTRNSRVP